MSFLYDDEYVPSTKAAPFVTCKTYVIMDPKKGKVLHEKNAGEVREMASLTKMMTAIVSIELAREMNLDLKTTYFRVSEKASQTTGTTAYLVEGQKLSIYDLLHGLMLPSGNDAAVTLAENFSERIFDAKTQHQKNNTYFSKSYSLFIKQMNATAKRIHVRNTAYTNPHGLADKANHSTAFDLAKIASYGMKEEIFRQVVNTVEYRSISYLPKKNITRLPNKDFASFSVAESIPFENPSDLEYVYFHHVWYNSNKLLGCPGFSGVKTGITSTAGPCLCIYFSNASLNMSLITVVLGSKNIEYRWKDTRRLTLWANAILEEKHT